MNTQARGWYTFVFALVSMGLFFPVYADVVQMHKEMLYPSVRVKVGIGYGSGTVIFSSQYEDEQHTYILTNHHVVQRNITINEEWSSKEQEMVKVEKLTPVTVEWFDYNDLSRQVGTRGKTAEIVAYDTNLDLAILRIRDKEAVIKHVATMAPEDRILNLFEGAWAIGSGLGQPPFPTWGMISNLDQMIQGNRYIFASAPIIFGNSGGTLYHYEDTCECYEMIGVPSLMSGSWATGPVTHMGWAIPMETIYKFLRNNNLHFIWGEEVPEEEDEDE